MNNNQNRATTTGAAACLPEQPDFLNPDEPESPARSQASRIQWPTEKQIREVSTRLANLTQMGAQFEAEGDYFRSGDLAYRVHEIIEATAELFKKSRRGEPSPNCRER